MHRVWSTVCTYCEKIYLIEKFGVFFQSSLICCRQVKPVVLVNRWSVWWDAELMGLQNVWNRWGFGISYHKIFWTYSGNQAYIKRSDVVKFSSLRWKRKSGGCAQAPSEQQCPGLTTRKHSAAAKVTWWHLTITGRSRTTGKSWSLPPGCV